MRSTSTAVTIGIFFANRHDLCVGCICPQQILIILQLSQVNLTHECLVKWIVYITSLLILSTTAFRQVHNRAFHP